MEFGSVENSRICIMLHICIAARYHNKMHIHTIGWLKFSVGFRGAKVQEGALMSSMGEEEKIDSSYLVRHYCVGLHYKHYPFVVVRYLLQWHEIDIRCSLQ